MTMLLLGKFRKLIWSGQSQEREPAYGKELTSRGKNLLFGNSIWQKISLLTNANYKLIAS